MFSPFSPILINFGANNTWFLQVPELRGARVAALPPNSKAPRKARFADDLHAGRELGI